MIRETPKIIGRSRHLSTELEHLIEIFQSVSVPGQRRQRAFTLRPTRRPREQMDRQALIEGGHTRVLAIHHLNDTRHGGHRGLRF